MHLRTLIKPLKGDLLFGGLVLKTSSTRSVFMAILILCGTAQAAVPKKAPSAVPSMVTPSSARATSAKLQSTKDALQLPADNRLAALLAQGPQGYRNLNHIMFDSQGAMDLRWRAVNAVAQIGGAESKPELEKALKSRDWFMRNAGLLSMANIDRKSGVKWARQLLSDPAMVVRAAAVATLLDLKDQDSTTLLWKKLYASENFKNHESLFVRRRIVEALAALETSGREAKFVALLNDKDTTLHPVAIHALERLTQQTLGRPTDSVQVTREQWQNWWKTQPHTLL